MTPHDLAVDTESLDTASIELCAEDVESLSTGPTPVLAPPAAPPVEPVAPVAPLPDRPEST